MRGGPNDSAGLRPGFRASPGAAQILMSNGRVVSAHSSCSLADARKIDLLNATRGVVAFLEEVVRRGCRL
jgi:hypothetical protein